MVERVCLEDGGFCTCVYVRQSDVHLSKRIALRVGLPRSKYVNISQHSADIRSDYDPKALQAVVAASRYVVQWLSTCPGLGNLPAASMC